MTSSAPSITMESSPMDYIQPDESDDNELPQKSG